MEANTTGGIAQGRHRIAKVLIIAVLVGSQWPLPVAHAQFGRRIIARRMSYCIEDVISQIVVKMPEIIILAMFEAMAREINLKLDELKKLEPLRDEFRRDLFAAFAEADFNPLDFANLEPEAFEQRLAASRGKMAEIVLKLNQKYDEKLTGLLTPEQRLRVRQVAWQFNGARSLLDPRISEPLQLTDAQRTQLESLVKEFDGKRQRWAGLSVAKRPAKVTDERDALRGERDENARALLTPEQQAKLKELYGKEVDVESIREQAFSGLLKFLPSRSSATTGPANEPTRRP